MEAILTSLRKGGWAQVRNQAAKFFAIQNSKEAGRAESFN
jgi:hypothetical protein